MGFQQNHAVTHSDRSQRAMRWCWRGMFTLLLVVSSASAAAAIPLGEYRERVSKAITFLDLLHEMADLTTRAQNDEFVATNIRATREALPPEGTVEWKGTTFTVDNSWLEDELQDFEKLSASDSKRSEVLDRILERLQALANRLSEIDKSLPEAGPTSAEMNRRLGTILQRPEYAQTAQKTSAFTQALRKFWKWFADLFPKRSVLNPGGARYLSRVAQIFVLVVSLAAIAYVVWRFLPGLLRNTQTRKRSKPQARVVLGEKLEPEQTANDLLAEAEALARAGDLRGAIRRGYIALLVELADRRIISLGQHKTNRDYLGAVREMQSLHRSMIVLTNNFEQHWYGLATAQESDWVAFRAGYKQVLSGEFRASS